MMRKIVGVLALICLFAVPAAAWRGLPGWTFQGSQDMGITSSVAVAGDLVLAGDGGGTFYAVQKASGALAWSYRGTNSVVGTPATADGKVVFVQSDGTVTCLNLANGSLIWNYVPAYEGEGLTIVDGAAIGDGKVYVAKGNGGLYALSLENGHRVWEYSSNPELRSAPAFGEGFVFLGEQNGRFSIIDPKTGKRVNGGGAGGPVNTPLLNDGDVYFSSWDGSVQRVQVKGVEPKWKASVGDPVSTSPVIGSGRVFVGTSNGLVAALSTDNGSVLWQYNTRGGSVNGMAFGEGLVFVSGGNGILYVLNAATGSLISSLHADMAGTPAYDSGVLFLGSGGNIFAIR